MTDEQVVLAITGYAKAGLSPKETCSEFGLVLGRRRWKALDYPSPRLISPLLQDSWPCGSPFLGECIPRLGRSPGRRVVLDPNCSGQLPFRSCRCGIYAFQPDVPFDVNALGVDEISGLVALWGSVIEHERGYRASRAYPMALERNKAALDEIFEQVAEAYDVPVIQV